MRTICKTMLGALCAVAYGLPSAAQAVIEEVGPESVVFVARTQDRKEEIIAVFKETQRPYFHDPGAPRFLLTDEKGKWALGIGGYIQAKAEYDFGGVVEDIDFYPSLISDGKPRNQFQTDITTSTLFLKLVGRTRRLGNFIVYTAGNWRGDGNTFELQNAYIQLLGFTIGYDTGTFMDLAACPPTIDYAGPCGMTFYRTTLLRYEHEIGGGFSACAAIELPEVEGTANGSTSVGSQRFPAIPAYVQYGWDKGNSHVRLGGICRNITYTDLTRNKTESRTGWGVQASAIVAACKSLRFFGQCTYGKGIGALMNDISNLNVDIVPDGSEEGKMEILPMSGWYAGTQYNFAPNVFASATYSCSRLYSRNGYGKDNSGQYKLGQYLVANLFWNVIPNLQLGVECLRGWRKDFSGKSDHADRVNLSVQFNF